MRAKRDAEVAKAVGDRLRVIRRRLGLTQQTWGEAAGLTRMAVSAFEQGTSCPSLSTLYALAEAAGIRVQRLLP